VFLTKSFNPLQVSLEPMDFVFGSAQFPLDFACFTKRFDMIGFVLVVQSLDHLLVCLVRNFHRHLLGCSSKAKAGATDAA
jgi:hypothetical protein